MKPDELVEACVHASGVDEPTVRKILARAQLLEDVSPLPPPVRLEIRQVQIEGRKPDGTVFPYSRDLASGIWLWNAPNLKGKTTVLRCIQWALTGDAGSLATKDWITAVQLTFAVDGDVHRVSFQRAGHRHEGKLEQAGVDAAWKVVTPFTSEAQHQRVVRDFFEARLGLARLEFVQRQAKSIKTTIGNVNWATYARALFLDEHEYGDLLLPPIYAGEQSQKILGAFLGLPDLVLVNRGEFALDQARIERERAELVAEKAGGEPKLAQERQRLRVGLEKIQTELLAEPEQTELAIALRKQEQAKAALQAAVAVEADAEAEFNAREQTIAAARSEDQMLQDAIVFRRFFNGIEVSHCPRCERPVESGARQRERDTGSCRVCSRAVPSTSEDRVNELVQERAALAKQIDELVKDRDAAEKRLATAQKRRAAAEPEWRDASDQVRAAAAGGAELLERRDQLNQELGRVSAQLATIEVPGGPELDQQRKVLEAAVDLLRRGQRTAAAEVIDAFCKLTLELARRVGLTELERVTLTDRGAVRFVEHGREKAFVGFSPGARLRLKIAVLLGLALLPTRTVTARHPRLLIVDSPAQHEMIDPDVSALAAFLRSLEDDLVMRDAVQVLVASAEPRLAGATVASKAEVREGPLF